MALKARGFQLHDVKKTQDKSFDERPRSQTITNHARATCDY